MDGYRLPPLDSGSPLFNQILKHWRCRRRNPCIRPVQFRLPSNSGICPLLATRTLSCAPKTRLDHFVLALALRPCSAASKYSYLEVAKQRGELLAHITHLPSHISLVTLLFLSLLSSPVSSLSLICRHRVCLPRFPFTSALQHKSSTWAGLAFPFLATDAPVAHATVHQFPLCLLVATDTPQVRRNSADAHAHKIASALFARPNLALPFSPCPEPPIQSRTPARQRPLNSSSNPSLLNRNPPVVLTRTAVPQPHP